MWNTKCEYYVVSEMQSTSLKQEELFLQNDRK